MVAAAIDRTRMPSRPLPHLRALLAPACVSAVSLLTLATMWPLARAVFGGTFSDPDDAMRLVEVRAWMAGQPWFNVGAMRLDPPSGASMHWSRLVDLPNAFLIHVFAAFTSNAEAWDRLVLPTLLLLALYAGMVRLTTVLLGRAAIAPALLGTFLTGVTLVLFQPGRIGHHGPETVALIWAVVVALASLDVGKARQGAVAGALVALSLAMSLETIPFLGALCVAMLPVWIVGGAPVAAALRAFALGLGVTLPVLFFATVDPRSWLAPVCDALGAAHLGAALLFAVGVFGIASWPSGMSSWPRRCVGAAVVGSAVALFVILAFPACLRSPFAAVDPLVRDVWLDHVVESLPLLVFLRGHPVVGFSIVLPTALGTLGCIWAAVSLRGTPAVRFAMVAGVSALGLALGFWQVRVFASVAPLALCGGLFAVDQLRARLTASGVRHASLFAAAAIVPFTSTGWAIALPAAQEPVARSGPSCLAPAALRPLARLPPGRIVAPTDGGSHLLEATAHTVFAAPYHRNNDGNRFALDVFLARPDAALALLSARHVGYVMTCPGLGETARLANRAPDSLAAQLQAAAVPPYLAPLPLADTPWRVYAVRPPPQ